MAKKLSGIFAAFLVIVAISLAGVAVAHSDAKKPHGARSFVMKHLPKHSAAGKKSSAIKPYLIGGQPAQSQDWPATRIFSYNGSFCTSTIVGPRTVLTAAHCVDDQAQGGIEVGNQSVPITCSRDPAYVAGTDATDSRNDMALCLAATDLTESGLQYENVVAADPGLATGATITLIGFGCTAPASPGSFGNLFFGVATVVSLPSNSDDAYQVGPDSSGAGAILCPGDSGGAAYTNATIGRQVIGANRSTNYQSSWVTAVWAPANSTFITTWRANNSAQVCGIDAATPNCRGS